MSSIKKEALLLPVGKLYEAPTPAMRRKSSLASKEVSVGVEGADPFWGVGKGAVPEGLLGDSDRLTKTGSIA